MLSNYEKKYLKILGKEFPTIQSVSTELINLTAILNLPKGTEHFISDIHGEYETFNHFLKNGSGVIREKIDILFKDLSEKDKNTLSFLTYYPKEMINKYEEILNNEKFEKWSRNNLLKLIDISRLLAAKYTKSKIRKSLPKEFAYIIEELIFETTDNSDKQNYYNAILDAIFRTKREKKFMIELARLIQRLTIDKLHIIGDIFDRGSYAHLVLDKLNTYHSIDIQWGNHDILWMGAASGSELCIANCIRISARYNNLDVLEDGYGINLVPLAMFAKKHYQNDECNVFMPKTNSSFDMIDEDKRDIVSKMHKAIAIIQFKLEYEIFNRNPEFNLKDRLFLDKIDYTDYSITIDEEKYYLNDKLFPTVNKKNPFKLTTEELNIVKHLKTAFLNNDKLQRHIKLMFIKGGMYLKYNGNLLFHGSIPLEKNGEFSEVLIKGKYYSGKALFDEFESIIRRAHANRYFADNLEVDYFVYLWQGENSPLFGKKEMRTFERYFIENKNTHYEEMSNYFNLREDDIILKNIYKEFSLDWDKSKIINGHVPVDINYEKMPIYANNRIYSIDGGMSRSYSDKISIGGYTLISDSYSIFLISHQRFPSKQELIKNEKDIVSIVQSHEINKEREYIYNTDKGLRLQNEIDDLYKLLEAYRSGEIKESKQN